MLIFEISLVLSLISLGLQFRTHPYTLNARVEDVSISQGQIFDQVAPLKNAFGLNLLFFTKLVKIMAQLQWFKNAFLECKNCEARKNPMIS